MSDKKKEPVGVEKLPIGKVVWILIFIAITIWVIKNKNEFKGLEQKVEVLPVSTTTWTKVNVNLKLERIDFDIKDNISWMIVTNGAVGSPIIRTPDEPYRSDYSPGITEFWFAIVPGQSKTKSQIVLRRTEKEFKL